jgi:hypothetical protein
MYEYGMEVKSIETLMGEGGVAAVPPQKLTTMLGDTVRVTLAVDYRGPAIDGKIRVAFGQKDTYFNEDPSKYKEWPVSFIASMDWLSHTFTCDILMGGSPSTNFDLYAKIMGVPGGDIFTPTYLSILDVLGASEFRNFAVTSYVKV